MVALLSFLVAGPVPTETGGGEAGDWPIEAIALGIAGAVVLVVGLVIVGWVSQRIPDPPPRSTARSRDD